MKTTGSITVTLNEESNIEIATTGDLNHIEKVGALTMALHQIEFTAMAKGN